MAPTYSNGQEMVSIYLIKIKITTKFFKFVHMFITFLHKPLYLSKIWSQFEIIIASCLKIIKTLKIFKYCS